MKEERKEEGRVRLGERKRERVKKRGGSDGNGIGHAGARS